MEVKNENGKSNSSSSGGCRWNPTKEQINMLEGFYRDGMRTPSTEQIQEMTRRLQAFGHIEGKNVFYWFQNHKARERQRQQRNQFEIVNNFHFNQLASSSSVPSVFSPILPFPPSTTNGVISSRNGGQMSNIGGYNYLSHSYSNKLPLPRITPTTCTRVTKRTKSTVSIDGGENMMMTRMTKDYNEDYYNGSEAGVVHETLTLFPLRPTHDNNECEPDNHSSIYSCSGGHDDHEIVLEDGVHTQPFFDFLGNLQR